jgi:hypothetical protein
VPEPEKRRLDVSIKLRELPARAAELRILGAADDARNEEVVRPRVEAHMATCRLVLDALSTYHARVADTTDLNLDGSSRQAAIWLVAGRCLGLLHAFLVQIGAGVCTEALVTARALHEANRLVFVFGQAGGEKLLRLWLEDEGRYGYVKPGKAREAQGEFEELLNHVLVEKGLPVIRETTELDEGMYDMLSRTAHNRRASCLDAVWLPARRMSYGYNASAVRRAAYASWAGALTVEVADMVGDALGMFFGRSFHREKIVPLKQSLEAIDHAQPLDERSIREAAGTAGA